MNLSIEEAMIIPGLEEYFADDNNEDPPDDPSDDPSDDPPDDPPDAPPTETMMMMKEPPKNPYKVAMSQLRDILPVPQTFEEAYYNADEWCRFQWRQAIKLELDKMKLLKVWHIVDKANVPKDRRLLIKNKWVFDIK